MAQSLNRMELGVQIVNSNQVLATDIINGSVDPSAGAGVAAETGSFYMQNAAGVDGGAAWLKFGDDDIDWVLFANSGGGAASAEDGFQNTFTGKTGLGSETPTYSSTNVVTTGNSLETAIGDLDAAIGSDGSLTAVTRAGGSWQVVASESAKQNLDDIDAAIGADADMASTGIIATTNTIFANLSALDSSVGADSALTPLTRTVGQLVASESTKQNLEDLDTVIGADADMTSTTYISTSQNIYQNLSDLDSQLASLSTGFFWKEAVEATTADTSKSGTGVLSDDDGGVYTPQVGDRVLVVDDGIYIVSAGAWALAADGTLSTGDTVFTQNDLTDTITNEKGAAYTFSSGLSVKVADFDFESADSIALTSGYAVVNGTVAIADTIEEAIEKLAGNQIDLTTLTGVSQGAVDLGTFTGTIIPDNSTIKAAFQSLESGIGSSTDLTPLTRTVGQLVNTENAKLNIDDLDTVIGPDANMTSTINISTSNDIYTNLSNLDAAVGSGSQASFDGLETTDGTVTLDSVLVTEVAAVEWLVAVHDPTNARRKAVKIFACHDNGTAVDFSSHIVLNAGAGNITTVTVTVDIAGGAMRLRIANSSATAVNVRARRHNVDI